MYLIKKYFLLLILIGTTNFVLLIIFLKNNQLRNLEEDLNNQSEIIEKCIDIDNKNNRSIYENIKLSEYCIDNFGNIK